MADSGGHWDSLEEMQKLTQSTQIAGVFEEDIKLNPPQMLLPVWQLTGLDLKWQRESVGQTATKTTTGATLTWQDAVKYDQLTVDLAEIVIQTPIDNRRAGQYGGMVAYEAIQLLENKKAMQRLTADQMVYGDLTFGVGDPEFDGFHAIAQAFPTRLNGVTNGLDIDEGEGPLSIFNMRKLRREMKYGIDFWLFPMELADRIDAMWDEAGVASFVGPGRFTKTMDQWGNPQTMFGGTPIIRTDYLVAEQANTGVGSDARAKNSSGTEQFSIFAIKRGQVALKQPGLGFIFGSDPAASASNQTGDLMNLTFFDKLENRNGTGIRLTQYSALADGSAMAIGRIRDITDAAVTA